MRSAIRVGNDDRKRVLTAIFFYKILIVFKGRVYRITVLAGFGIDDQVTVLPLDGLKADLSLSRPIRVIHIVTQVIGIVVVIGTRGFASDRIPTLNAHVPCCTFPRYHSAAFTFQRQFIRRVIFPLDSDDYIIGNRLTIGRSRNCKCFLYRICFIEPIELLFYVLFL